MNVGDPQKDFRVGDQTLDRGAISSIVTTLFHRGFSSYTGPSIQIWFGDRQ